MVMVMGFSDMEEMFSSASIVLLSANYAASDEVKNALHNLVKC